MLAVGSNVNSQFDTSIGPTNTPTKLPSFSGMIIKQVYAQEKYSMIVTMNNYLYIMGDFMGNKYEVPNKVLSNVSQVSGNSNIAAALTSKCFY